MEQLSLIRSKYKLAKVKGEDSEERFLASEIYEYLGKKLNYARIRKIIKENGAQCVREILTETQKARFPYKLQLFLSMVKKYQTKLK